MWDVPVEAWRRLDTNMNGPARLFAAIEAANRRVALDTPHRPNLIGRLKAAEYEDPCR
jgi:hypothetical protein